MEQGPREKKILEICFRQNKPIPNAIRNAPELLPGLSLFMDAYLDLMTCRLQSGHIPWTAINEWAKRYELDQETAHDLLKYIPALNSEWFIVQKRIDDRMGNNGQS